MCNVRLGILLILAAALASRPAAAQTIAELQRRVEHRRAEWLAAAAIRDSLRASRQIVADDTLRIGGLTVVGSADDLARLHPAIALGWERAAGELGADTSLVARTTIHVTLTEQWRPRGSATGSLGRLLRPFADFHGVEGDSVHAGTIVDVSTGAGLGLGRTRLPGGVDLRLAAPTIRNGVWASVASLVDSAVVGWGGAVVPEISSGSRRTVYRELVTTRYSTARECVAHDLGACRKALGLTATDTPLRDWYSLEDLAAWVRRDRRPDQKFFPDRSAWYDGCTMEQNVTNCVQYLSGPSLGDRTPAPLGLAARQLALAVALDIGGSGAITRLIDSRGSVPRRVAAAAGVSVDSLVSAWRAAAYSGAGKPTAINAASGGAALVWFGFLALAALGGRRWR